MKAIKPQRLTNLGFRTQVATKGRIEHQSNMNFMLASLTCRSVSSSPNTSNCISLNTLNRDLHNSRGGQRTPLDLSSSSDYLGLHRQFQNGQSKFQPSNPGSGAVWLRHFGRPPVNCDEQRKDCKDGQKRFRSRS